MRHRQNFKLNQQSNRKWRKYDLFYQFFLDTDYNFKNLSLDGFVASGWLNKSDNQILNDTRTRFIAVINGKTYMVDATSPKEIKPAEDFWNVEKTIGFIKKN